MVNLLGIFKVQMKSRRWPKRQIQNLTIQLNRSSNYKTR